MYKKKYLKYKQKYLKLKNKQGGSNYNFKYKVKPYNNQYRLFNLHVNPSFKSLFIPFKMTSTTIPSLISLDKYSMNKTKALNGIKYNAKIFDNINLDLEYNLNETDRILILSPGMGSSGMNLSILYEYGEVIYSSSIDDKENPNFALSNYGCGNPSGIEGMGNMGWLIASLQNSFKYVDIYVFDHENKADISEVEHYIKEKQKTYKHNDDPYYNSIITASKGNKIILDLLNTENWVETFFIKVNLILINSLEDNIVELLNNIKDGKYKFSVSNFILTSHSGNILNYNLNKSFITESCKDTDHKFLLYRCNHLGEDHSCPLSLMKFNKNITNNNRYTLESNLVHLIKSINDAFYYDFFYSELFSFYNDTPFTYNCDLIHRNRNRNNITLNKYLNLNKIELELGDLEIGSNITYYHTDKDIRRHRDENIINRFYFSRLNDNTKFNIDKYLNIDIFKKMILKFNLKVKFRDLIKPHTDGNYYIYHGSQFINHNNPEFLSNFNITLDKHRENLDKGLLVRSTSTSIRPLIRFDKANGMLGKGFYFSLSPEDVINYACFNTEDDIKDDDYVGIIKIKLKESILDLDIANYFDIRMFQYFPTLFNPDNEYNIMYKYLSDEDTPPIYHDSLFSILDPGFNFMDNPIDKKILINMYFNICSMYTNNNQDNIHISLTQAYITDILKGIWTRHNQFCFNLNYLLNNGITNNEFINMYFDDMDILSFKASKNLITTLTPTPPEFNLHGPSMPGMIGNQFNNTNYTNCKDRTIRYINYTNPSNPTLSIHGPISYYYYNINGKLGKNKKILLFGDQHTAYKHDLTDLDFANFLGMCINQNIQNNSCLDFFMESSYKLLKNKIFKGGSIIEENIMINKLRDIETNVNTNNAIVYTNDKYYINLNNDIKSFTTEEEAKKVLKKYQDLNYKINTKGFRFHNWEISQILKIKDTTIIKKNHVIFYTIYINEDEMNTDYKLLFDFFGIVNDENFDDNLKKKSKQIFYYLIGSDDNYNYNEGKRLVNKLISSFNKVENIWLNEVETLKVSIKNLKRLTKLDNNYCNINLIMDFFNDKLDNLTFDFTSEHKTMYDFIGNIRLLFTDYYAITRMFTIFDSSKERIENCNNENSLTKIFYFGGQTHTFNVINFIKFLIKKNTDITLLDSSKHENINELESNNIHRIDLPIKVLNDFNFDF